MTFGTTNQIMAGAEVYGSDNDKIGTVADVGQNYFLVQKGFLFIKDLYLPTRTIARVDADRVYLSVTKREAEDMATEELPSEGDAWYGTSAADAGNRSTTGMTGTTTGTSYTTDTTGTTGRMDSDRDLRDGDPSFRSTGTAATTGAAMGAGAAGRGYGSQIREEMDVYGSDGDRLGDVDEVGANYFKVGQFFGRDVYLPTSSVARVEGDNIHLNLTKEQAQDTAADRLPAEGDAWYGSTTTSTSTAYDTTNRGTTGRADYADTANRGTTDRRAVSDRDSITVPVVEEQLRAGVRETNAGSARVVKDVAQEQQSIDVPVQREEAYVTMRDVQDRPATQADLDMRDREIEIPLREQEVVVDKQQVVTGEVDVRKEVVTDTERVSDNVRRETVHVEDPNNPHIHVEGGLAGSGRATSGSRRFSADQQARYDAMSPNLRTRYESLSDDQRAEYDTRYPLRRDNKGNILDPDGDGENAFEELGRNVQQGTNRPGNRNR